MMWVAAKTTPTVLNDCPRLTATPGTTTRYTVSAFGLTMVAMKARAEADRAPGWRARPAARRP